MAIAKLLQAPNDVEPTSDSVFLAGGISGWREEAIERLSSFDGTILNPHRDEWPTDIESLGEQLEWERKYLKLATLRAFWFSGCSLAPMTMLELGQTLGAGWPFVAGVEQGHPREDELRVRIQLACPGVSVCCSVEALSLEILRWFEKKSEPLP
ncbi:MAG: nucleoside 2-deoxyribosyltransferase domain-containing protein [Planctomycetaceae bacterium]